MPPMLMNRIDSVMKKIEAELGSPRAFGMNGSPRGSPRRDLEPSSARGAETMLATADSMDRDIRRIEACKRMQLDLEGLQQTCDPQGGDLMMPLGDFAGNGMDEERIQLRQMTMFLQDKMDKLEDLHRAMSSRGRLPSPVEDFASPEVAALRERERLLRGELAEAEAFSAATLRQKALAEQERAKQSRIDAAQIEDLKNQLSNARVVAAKQEAKIRQGEADLLRIADLERQVWAMRHSKGLSPVTPGDYDLQKLADPNRAYQERLHERVAELENQLEHTHAAERRQGEALADAVQQLHIEEASRVAAERILAEEHGTTPGAVDAVVQAMAAKQINHPQHHSSRRRANSSSLTPQRVRGNSDHPHHLARHTIHHHHHLAGDPNGSRVHSPLTSTFEKSSHPLSKATRSPSSAEDLNRRAMEECEAQYGPDHPDTLLHASRLADSLQDMGRYHEANVPYQRALDGRRRVLGADDLSTMETMSNYAMNLKKQGKLPEAESLFRQALQGREARLGRSHSDTLVSVWNLGQLLKEEGRYDEAEEMFHREIQGHQERLGPDHDQTRRRVEHLKLFREQHGRHVDNSHHAGVGHRPSTHSHSPPTAHGHRASQEHRPSTSSRVSKTRSAQRRSVGSDLGIVGDSDGSGAEDSAMRELAQLATIHGHGHSQHHTHHPSTSSSHGRHSAHSQRHSADQNAGRSSLHVVGEQEPYPSPPTSLPHVAPKATAATRKKGVSALLKGLRSGEVSKIVDNMEVANSDHTDRHSLHELPANNGLHMSQHHTLASDGLHVGLDLGEPHGDAGLHVPSSVAPVKAAAATKKKGVAALLKGLRSGEVSKIVDNMEAANDISATNEVGSSHYQPQHHISRGSNVVRNSSSSLGVKPSSPYDAFVLGSPHLHNDGDYQDAGYAFQRVPTDTTTVYEDLTMNMSSSDSREDFRGPHMLG